MANRTREQYTCRCSAYKFPHRFGGGRCSGIHIAVDHWNTYWGHDSACKNCNNFDDNTHNCDVLSGGAPVRTCEIVIDFVLSNEINFKV